MMIKPTGSIVNFAKRLAPEIGLRDLCYSPDGYISVNEILQHKTFRGKYSQADIERVVQSNDKQRFKLRVNPTTEDLEIRANQGHTITEVSETTFTPILEPIYKTVVHGTYRKCWSKVRTDGLNRMKRQHIHFAKGILGDETVISGLRRNVELYIYVDLEKALSDGIKFFESENGVILTSGDDQGYLQTKYFKKVIDISTGEQLFP